MVVTSVGQISQGDTIHCEYKGGLCKYVAEEVLNKGTVYEEVIIDLETNRYFITSLVLDGSSWAKNVHVLSKQN